MSENDVKSRIHAVLDKLQSEIDDRIAHLASETNAEPLKTFRMSVNGARHFALSFVPEQRLPIIAKMVDVTRSLYEDYVKSGDVLYLSKAGDFLRFDSDPMRTVDDLDIAEALQEARFSVATDGLRQLRRNVETYSSQQINAALNEVNGWQTKVNDQLQSIRTADLTREASVEALLLSSTDRLNTLTSGFESHAAANQQRFDQLIGEMGTLGKAVSVNALADSYSKAAAEEAKAAKVWERIALASLVAWVLIVLWQNPQDWIDIISGIVRSPPPDASSAVSATDAWKVILGKLLRTFPLVVLIGFASVKANKCSKTARYYTLLQMEFYALNPFLDQLPADAQVVIKTQLAPRMFGDRTAFSAEADQQADVIGEISKLLQGARAGSSK